MGTNGNRFRDEVGKKTVFGGVPSWKVHAYRVRRKGNIVHLVSRLFEPHLLTLCGWAVYVEEDGSPIQWVLNKPVLGAIGWDGLKQCGQCERLRRAYEEE